MPFTLNPDLRAAEAQAAFAEHRRVQLPDLLAAESAERLLAVVERLPWLMVFNNRDKVFEIPAEKMADYTPDQQFQIINDIHARAATGYQFYYHSYPVVGPYFAGGEGRGPLAEALELLNSPALLDAMRAITGRDDIRWADAHASLYGPGHFLNNHDDRHGEHDRVAAYVLGLTRDWSSDWGGYLQFFDERRNIVAGYKPDFNVLNLFAVPFDHAVGIVAPFAAAPRYAITGWLRADDPPGEIGA